MGSGNLAFEAETGERYLKSNYNSVYIDTKSAANRFICAPRTIVPAQRRTECVMEQILKPSGRLLFLVNGFIEI